jgi:hypothetical protein
MAQDRVFAEVQNTSCHDTCRDPAGLPGRPMEPSVRQAAHAGPVSQD